MKDVSMSTFARFCIAGPGVRDKMARQFAGVEQRRGGNPNGALYGMLRRTHWRNGDIAVLVGATPRLNPTRQDYQQELDRIMAIKEDYLAEWRERAEGFFSVDPVGVIVAGMTVRVDPEVGMETREDPARRPLKLWFRGTRMSGRYAAVYHYLLKEAIESTTWPVSWFPGIWDVQGRRISYLPRQLPHGTEGLVDSAAEDFVARYRILTG